jgi:PAS domain S-box-containing protein
MMNNHHSNGPPLADLVGRIGLREHLCIIYETQDEQLSAAIPFIRIGLDRGEKCVYMADSNSSAIFTNAARKQGINIDAAIRQGSLAIAGKEMYSVHGDFEPDRWIEIFEKMVGDAKSEGFSALRLMGEMTWITATDPRPERLIEFEAKFNQLARDRDILGMCLYEGRLFQPNVILQVLRIHPTIVYGGYVCENPYYVPPEEFLHPRHDESEIRRMLDRLREDAANRERLRQSEERIRQNSEQHEKETRALIDTIPQQIWSGPPDGTLDFCNERWRSYMGLSLEELQGDGWQSVLHPDDRERVLRAWQHSVATGTPYEQEERHRGADGNYRWFLSRGLPLRDAEGRIVRWYGTNTDIEDYKRAEQKLQQLSGGLLQLLNTIPTMAWSVQPDGAVDFVNQCWLDYTGLTLEQEIEEPTRVVHPEDLPRVMEKWLVDMAAGEPSEDEMRLQRADGEYCWFLVRTAPLRDERGNIVKWYGVSIDIEDRKRAEEKLRKLTGSILQSQDEERRRIARELHDSTGQDLVVLQTIVGQLQESAPSIERRMLLSDVKALADKCIRDVRTLSYLLYPPELDQAGLLGALREHVKGFTERSGIHVELDLPPELKRMAPEIELALFRVVQESLTNIQRHSGNRHAKIRLIRNASLTLEISDTRGGSSDHLEKNNAAGPPIQFGVGISSMQERIMSIGGRLEIDSTTRGTIVRVTVPLGEGSEKAAHSTG